MMRLLVEEEMGNPEGVTPTVLSHFQRVSKNTVSALLRGLEEQGLIQRDLDPADLRVFRIQLTNAGRELVLKTTPRRIEWINELLGGLEPEERVQLAALLEKLSRTLRSCIPPHDRQD
jgi:DNA-binding MarR family transcriptional regulator